MRLPRVRLTVRWLMVAVAILAGLTWAWMMAQRARHYYGQAEVQARLEATYRAEAQRLRADPSGFDADVFAKSETKEANHHARLKEQYRRLATHPWESAPPDLPLPYPWDRDRDRAVLETALADLMDPKNPDNAIAFQANSGSYPEVVVAEMTYSWLNDSQRDEGEEAWNDLLRRNSGGPILITGLGLGGKMRVRYDDPERLYEASANEGTDFRNYFQKRYPRACGFVWVTLPGYSRDGRATVIFFGAGDSPHGVDWTYDLERTNGGWEVRKRQHHIGE
jgi:hypothetical protein